MFFYIIFLAEPKKNAGERCDFMMLLKDKKLPVKTARNWGHWRLFSGVDFILQQLVPIEDVCSVVVVQNLYAKDGV